MPAHDVHDKFVEYAPSLLSDDRSRRLFRRMAERAQIDHRYSFVEPDPGADVLDRIGFFPRGAFPGTEARMGFYEAHAFGLAARRWTGPGCATINGRITHLIVTTCTGFYAPGLDLQIVEHFGLADGVERTMVGFMGCQAAIPGVKLAAHIVRSQPAARVLMVNLELCTIHLQETSDLQSVLSFLIFADGCAASLISAEPEGLQIDGFSNLGAAGKPRPDRLAHRRQRLLDVARRGRPRHDRPRARGSRPCADRRPPDRRGRAVGGASGRALDPRRGPGCAGARSRRLADSREVLRTYGNMSSATVMFVLARMLAASQPDQRGLRRGLRAWPQRRGDDAFGPPAAA